MKPDGEGGRDAVSVGEGGNQDEGAQQISPARAGVIGSIGRVNEEIRM